MTYFEQWNNLVGQIAQLQLAMKEVDVDSPYHERAKEYEEMLLDMIKEAWLTDVLSAPAKAKKAKKPKKVRKPKATRGRTPIPYINNVEDRQRIVDILAHIITTRFTGDSMLLMDDTTLSTPRFFAYTFSALHEAGIPEKDNLSAFCEILSDAVAKAGMEDTFTTEYTAIYTALKKWNKWKGENYPYDFVHISELSVKDLKDQKQQQKLLKAKHEYDQVLEVLRDEQLISPPEKVCS